MSKLIIEFKDDKTREVFMRWMEDSGHVCYQGDMEFADNIERKNMVEEFYYNYSKGTISTV